MRLLYILIINSIIFCLELQASSSSQVDSQESIDSIERYLDLLVDQKHSAELYANLGYAYYQQNDLGKAILYYEKAIRLEPHNGEFLESIRMIRSELPVQITYIPDFIIVRLYRNAYNLLNSTTWSILQLLLFACLLYFLYIWLFRELKYGPLYQWVIFSLLLLSIVLSSFFAYHRKQYEIGGYAGISMGNQIIYQAPDQRSEEVVSIGPGNKVFILDQIGEWYKVQLRDKDIGWIQKDQISII